MKLLITGGKGFIARNLAAGLGTGHKISAPGRDELDLGDAAAVQAFIRSGQFDAVIHCATYDAAPKTSVKDPAKVLENNLRMFFNLARCKPFFGRMIFFGSGAEFSREHWVPKMAEDYFDTHVPADQYGFSKYIMTKYAQSAEGIYNLRLFGLFGPDDDWRYRFIPNMCARAVAGQPLVINKDNRYDFLYIGDLVKIVGYFLSAPAPVKKAYNVCSGSVSGFRTIAELVLKISGKKLPVEVGGKGLEYGGDNSALLKEMRGLEFTPLETAIGQVYAWLSHNKEQINQADL